MNKGNKTKEFILQKGLNFASRFGLTNISIGKLALECELSRSGLFAHFKSKEQLQLQILEFATEEFINTVIVPSEEIEDPKLKLESLCSLWPKWVKKCSLDLKGGCIFMSASFEFDHRDGAVKNYILRCQKRLLSHLEGVFFDGQSKSRFNSKFSPKQLAFDFYGKYVAFHIYKNFLKDKESELRLEQSINHLLTSISV